MAIGGMLQGIKVWLWEVCYKVSRFGYRSYDARYHGLAIGGMIYGYQGLVIGVMIQGI